MTELSNKKRKVLGENFDHDGTMTWMTETVHRHIPNEYYAE